MKKVCPKAYRKRKVVNSLYEKKPNAELTSPLKAIKQHCIFCGDGTYNELKNCQCTDCELWHFRFGKNPYLSEKRKNLPNNFKYQI